MCFFQSCFRGGGVNFTENHQDSGFGAVTALLQGVAGGNTVGTGGGAHNAYTALHQLFVAGAHINHQVAIHFAQLDHGGGGKHVQHHFLGSAAFQAGGTGNNFRPRHGGNANVSPGVYLTAGAAGYTDDRCAKAVGILHRTQHIGGAAAGGNTAQNILLAEIQLFQVLFAKVAVVLGALHRDQHGALAARNNGIHHIAPGAECRQAFGCIQHAKTAGSTTSAINQPSAFLQRGVNHIHSCSDLRQNHFHRFGYFFVLLVHQADDLKR